MPAAGLPSGGLSYRASWECAMGQLRKRGNTWWIRYYRNGKRYEESSGSTKESDARTLLRQREGDVAKGVPVAPTVGRIRFEEAATDLLNDYRSNGKRTLDDLERRVDKHLRPYFEGRRLAAITTADIRSYIAARQRARTVEYKPFTFVARDGSPRHVPPQKRVIAGVSNGEINRELTALKRMFTLAVQAGKLLNKPYIPMLKEQNVRTGFFEPEQFRAMLRHLRDEARPVVIFAYITGWRIDSEVLPLQWRQVDLREGEVRLEPGATKNGDGRVFPMTRDLKALLERQRAATTAVERSTSSVCPWVFHRSGRPIRSLRGAFRAACIAAGCPGRLLHDLRRTAVRNLVRAAIPERVAMKMTGHRTRSVFERYNIVSGGDLVQAARRLDARYASSHCTEEQLHEDSSTGPAGTIEAQTRH